jgi:hypothetical protein
VAGDETTMPAQHGGGLHDQQHLRQPAPIQCLGDHGQDRPVRLGEPGPSHLALQHQDLVAQGQDLCVATIAADQQRATTRRTNRGNDANTAATVPDRSTASDQQRRLLGTHTPAGRSVAESVRGARSPDCAAAPVGSEATNKVFDGRRRDGVVARALGVVPPLARGS